jgi:hypothetical protein
LSAVSIASEPPPTKKMRPTSIGTSSVILSASSTAGGVANPTQFVKNGSVSSCFCAASVIPGQGP